MAPRVTQQPTEVATSGAGGDRVTQVPLEITTLGNDRDTVTQLTAEINTTDPTAGTRVTQFLAEFLTPAAPFNEHVWIITAD